MIAKEKRQATKAAPRKRTPTNMIRPKVQSVLTDMLASDRLFPRREIATRAGISQQTLYAHGLDLVEATEKEWVASHETPLHAAKRLNDEKDVVKTKDEEIRRLQKQLNDITERMKWMIEAVQQYAPSSLPHVTHVLLPDYKPNKR